MIDFSSLLNTISANPWLASVSIIVATFISEDMATVAAGILAIGGIPVPVALGSLYVGIVAGDAGLYGLGRMAHASGWAHRWAHRWVSVRTLVQGRKWLRRRLIPALVGARFTPGMRFPTFVASGFLRISFWRYFTILTCVAIVWSTFIFTLTWKFGDHILKLVGRDAKILGAVVIFTMLVLPMLLRWRASRKKAAKGAAT